MVERIAHAKRAGFAGVEISFPYDDSPQTIKNELIAHDIPLTMINIPTGTLFAGGDGLACVPTCEYVFRQAVQTCLAWAHDLGVPQVNLLAGRQPQYCDLSACLQTLVDNIRYAADAFAEVGISVLLEAINTVDMPRSAIATLAQQLEMYEAVNHHNVALQCDIYHMAMQGMSTADIVDTLEHYHSYIAHIQFADYPHRHEPQTGSLNFAMILACIVRLMHQEKYTGYVAAAYRPSQTTRSTLDWLTIYQ